MKQWMLIGALVAAVVGAFCFGRVTAQEGKNASGQEMEMPAHAKMTAEHKQLQKSAGDWNVDMTMWMGPQPSKMVGKAKRETLLGGRFVRETFTGNFMGQAFEGQLLEGFDPVKKQHVSVWVDNMSSLMLVSHGQKKDGVIHMVGEGVDPMTGAPVENRQTIEIKNDDETSMTMYKVDPKTKQPIKTMHMVYRRKK